jgi:hypothetical protein
VTLARTQVPISWMAPLLDLRVTADDTTSVNEPVDFRILLANPGNLAAENVKLVMNLQNPALQASYPLYAPKDQGNLGATWTIGSIAPGHLFEAIVQLLPTQEADYRILFNATASPNLTQSLEKPLLAVRPEIELRFAPAPGNEQAEINQAVVLEAVATNRSRQTMNNLTLLIDSEPGLQHAETGGNRVSQTIPYLPAGQSQSLGFRFIVQKPGDLKASLKAQIQNVVAAERTAVVRGIAPVPRQPAMAVQLVPQAPNLTLQPNAQVGVSGFVKNPGQTRLTNIQAVVQYAPSLSLTQASSGIDHQIQNRAAQWFIPVLEPGQQFEAKLVFQSIAATPPPSLQMSARSSEGLVDQTNLSFNVGNDGGTDRPTLPFTPPDANVLPPASSGPSPSANDPLSFQLLPIEQTVGIGQRSRFEIRFQNGGSVQDQNAEVMLRLPQGVQVTDVRYRDGTLIRPTFEDNNLMRIPPILTVRPGETISMIVELQHAVTGGLPLEAFLRTAAFPQGFTRQATINVRPN